MSTPQPSENGADTADTVLAQGVQTQPRRSEAATDTMLVGNAPRRRDGAPAVTRGATLGRYIVLDRLGAGGMGVVFSAFDPELDRKVAVKVLQATSRSNKATAGRVRLLREAQAMAKLSHPNVIPVYDVGTLGDNVFIAMEFIAGQTLRAWVQAARERGELDWRQTLELFMQAGRGLAAAHAAGIIHRDFKPENVMIDAAARARVLDFGLARPSRETTSPSEDADAPDPGSGTFELRLTATGALMGTPFYMAPEQHSTGAVDERADQFSFCVAVWEALYGERPFAGTSLPELMRGVLDGEVQQPPRGTKVPLWVQRALERGLRRQPEDRHPGMDDLLAALSRDPSARRRLLGIGAGLVMVPTAAVVGTMLVAGGDPPCSNVDNALAEVWNDDARQRIRSAFVPLEKADGRGTFERVDEAMTDYATAWVAARTDACEAARVRSEQSEAVLDLRYACLDERAHRLDGVVEAFAQADDAIVFRAASMVEGLPPIEDCADVPTLRHGVQPPADPAVRRKVFDIRKRIDIAAALAVKGNLEEVHTELDDLLREADATGYLPVRGDVLTMRGRLLMFAGDPGAAEEAFEQAQLIGEREGYDGLIAVSTLWMAGLDGTRRNAFTRAHRLLRRAEAVLERMGNPPRFVGQLHLTYARVLAVEQKFEASAEHYELFLAELERQGRLRESIGISTLAAYGHQLTRIGRDDEAETAILRALELGRVELGAGHPELASVQIFYGRLLERRNRAEDALDAFAQAREIFSAAYGAEHSNVGAVLNDEALVLAGLGRFDDALAKYRAAAPIILSNYGENNVQFGNILNNMGSLLIDRGDPEAALEPLTRALKIRAEGFGEDSETYATARELVGDAHAALGNTEEARIAYETANRVLRATTGDTDAIAHSHLGLGDLDATAGRWDDADDHYTQALAVLEDEDDPDDPRRARAEFGRARVALGRGEDRQAALALARRAQTSLRRMPAAAAHLRAVTAWLTEHSP